MIRRIFLTGLATIIPIAITWYVIIDLFKFVDHILGKFINNYLEIHFGYQVPGLGIIISLIIIFIIGLILKLTRMKISHFLEKMIFRIPLVKSIYFPIKEMANFLFLSRPYRFRSVVLVEYPRRGIYTVGFITNKNSCQFIKGADKKFYSIFLPSSPSPLTGVTVVMSCDDLTFLDITVEEALRFIVSGGTIGPDEKK